MKQVISDILVVDDNESNRILMIDILETAGYSVREVVNGEQALLSIKTKKPALVILDIILPGIDGYEVCRKIKSNKNTREIPVVFISALETDQSKSAGFMAGGVDYISKPFSKNEVLARVGTHINLYRLQSKLKRKNEKLEREILKRKNAEEELHISLNNYRQLIDGMNETFWVIDFEGNLIDVNKTAEKTLGYSKNELLSIGLIGIDGSLSKEMIVELAHSMPRDELQIFETTHKSKDGRVIPVEVYSSIVIWQGKEAIISIARDISNQKNALETIQSERKLLRTLIDNLPDAIYIKDKEARKIVANAADLKIMNCSTESMVLGKTDLEIFDDENGQLGYAEDISVIKTGKAIHKKENFYHDTNGDLHWRIISKIPLTDNQGNIQGLIGFGRDTTEQKKAEKRIRTLSKAIEQGPSSIIITNAEGVIEFVNDRFTDLTQYSIKDVIGTKPRIFNPGHLSPIEYDTLWDCLENGSVWKGEWINRRKDNTVFWEEVTISSITDDKGQVTNYILILDDISPKKRIVDELISAKLNAEESDRLKSAFLANISHEIRTPMNSIMGFASLLPNEENKELISNYSNIIIQNSEQLVNLIDNIVLYSKLQTGMFALRPTTFEAKKLMNDIKQSFDLPIYQEKVTLRFVCGISGNTMMFTDYDKLRQIITNLISNAFKYTPEGEITVGCDSEDELFKFFVKDTGIGIPQKDIDHVFERFYRGSNVNEATIRGTGLGLSIVRELVGMLGGKIWAESNTDGLFGSRGSTFYFTIPKQ